ncbi:3-deoxy-manno-octulosonate-8-phosphatase KdsC [Pseudoalteromonas sp. SMS1]|uniref:3-deoxy-manno-octulosonate-8-phosphatase KdsC n=1 Tax=Pseudoalteromonas sp. SMS1 TaxID=2908894 RepID=UPI001F3E4FE7|nr:3-deoxy-manno-octulosonate-8-phosphatase KdsC [Pseudoalteromonas sp. SMS1]MCF2857487.1 3-deoxy-manno-octulosonate-8-phosphatase KdsC [Pseudoalteromonas sp. SMS1]
MHFSELYQPITPQTSDKSKAIKLLICDIDGVFSDGRIYLGNHGEELKAFNTKDGFGIKALVASGVDVAVITGRHSEIVKQRMTSLNVTHIYQGQENKVAAYEELKMKLGLEDAQIAYIGDDGPDIPVMKLVGLAVAVADAHPLVKQLAHYTTMLPGGFGAVRELTDLLMLSQGNELITQGSST